MIVSGGGGILRVFKHRDELYQYLIDRNHGSANMFNNSNFIMKLAHFSNIFQNLKALITSHQGGNSNVFQLGDKLKAFIKKLNCGREN
jgi:hypothetical protein